MADKQTQPTQERSQMQKPEAARAQPQSGQDQPERGMERRGQQSGTLARSGGYGGSPFSMMRRMMEDMDRLFEDFGFGGMARALSPFGFGGGGGAMEAFNPDVEVFEREGKLVVRADLPGLKREDIRVHVDEDGLLLEGERKSEHEEKREGYYHSERSYGSFQRRIPLPRGVDPQACDASFENGVLEVKVDLPKENRRRIEVRGGGAQEQSKPTMKH